QPVANNLFLREAGSSQRRRAGCVELPLLIEVGYRELDTAAGFFPYQPGHLALEARVIPQQVADLYSSQSDRSAPAVARIDSRRMLKLHQMLDDPHDMTAES